MRTELLLGLLLFSVAGGCQEKTAGTGATHSSNSGQELKGVRSLNLADFALVDNSDEIHRKHGTEELKDTLAYLGEPVGLEVGGQYIEFAPAETLLIYRRSEVFATTGEEQTFRLALVAGWAGNNHPPRRTADIEISGVPALPAGQARIEIAVQIGGQPPTNIRGDVTISARERTSETELMIRRIK